MPRGFGKWWTPALVLLLAVGTWATLAGRVWGFTVDDAFITFRYARNWAEGFGPTYNPGGGPAEGYTTFLWMLLMTLPHLLRLDVVPFAKIVGMAAMLGCGAVIFAFANHLLRNLSDGRRYLLAAGAVLLFAITPATAIHAISGMETALFTFLLTAFLFLLTSTINDELLMLTEIRHGRTTGFQPAQHQTLRIILTAITALLLGLCRPEGNIAVWVGFAVALLLLPAGTASFMANGMRCRLYPARRGVLSLAITLLRAALSAAVLH